jgi:hypothetical protein
VAGVAADAFGTEHDKRPFSLSQNDSHVQNVALHAGPDAATARASRMILIAVNHVGEVSRAGRGFGIFSLSPSRQGDYAAAET